MVLGPLRHLGTLFLEGPQGLVPSTSGIISPALKVAEQLSEQLCEKPQGVFKHPPPISWTRVNVVEK